MKILMIPSELIDPVNELSANTRARCEAGLKAWESGEFDRILVSGGKFLPDARQTIAAAHLMNNWLVGRGVPEDRVLKEIDSLDTYQNIRRSLELLWTIDGSHQITVLTQYQHCVRFLLTFWLAHSVRVRFIPIRQPAMSWKDWTLEWAMIAYHALDWCGTWRIARKNRERRREDALR